jgi:hypothetical protein
MTVRPEDVGFLLGASVLFGLYTEYNIGNICYRNNDQGGKTLDLKKMLPFMTSPLYKKDMWYPSMLPYNYLVYMGTMSVPWYYFRN